MVRPSLSPSIPPDQAFLLGVEYSENERRERELQGEVVTVRDDQLNAILDRIVQIAPWEIPPVEKKEEVVEDSSVGVFDQEGS